MWVPKWRRDRNKGVDSPMPTQIVSNEEFIPRPQNKNQAQVEYLIDTMATEKAKKLGIERRDFLRSSMGMATAFLASNMVYGQAWAVDEEETLDPATTAEKIPKGEYFIFDVQGHFTNGVPLDYRNWEVMKNMGFEMDNDADSYGFNNFVKEMYFDSETSMVLISGVPGKELNRDKSGRVLHGQERTGKGPGALLPSWLMSQRKKDLNEIAQSTRALCQGNCAPNHYWDKATNKQSLSELMEQIEREVNLYGIDSWKWYCHADPGRSGNGFRCDDEELTYPFYEKSKELGLKIFSVHKGFASQSRTLGHFAHPGDLEKAALDHPDLTFIAYHSALRHGPAEPEFSKDGFYDPTTGDFEWHADMIAIKERNPQINNIYPEIGSSYGLLAIAHPEMCQHLMGRNIKAYGADHVIWGTDCLWWGSPQWVIDSFKRFQISDELCEKFGYSKLTKEDKAKIFGLNSAKMYGIDPDASINAFPADTFTKLREEYADAGGQRDNAAHGWVRDEIK
jgi:hypothetical protein